MRKFVDQVYFMKKCSKQQGLKIAISQQFSYVKFSMIIFSLSVGIIYIYSLYQLQDTFITARL